ncbi:MAG: argininosuccinate synthase [Planctomycetota bacterium]|jgi:argininosuccinate synthase|nr:argininosuccinate synthase [Planctomycetota bacterium]
MSEKVILLYSGGLDTSVICKWLAERGYEVVCYAGDVGQREDWAAVEKKALASGAKKIIVADLKEKFVRDFVYPAMQFNALYEGRYFLGTSLARPCIAEELVKIAAREKAATFAHGATGKGNDQVRFEFTAAALAPKLKALALWRTPEFQAEFKGREDLLAYAAKHKIPVKATAKKPWSSDENSLHISFEAGVLEDPFYCPDAKMFELSVSPQTAPNKAEIIELEFAEGLPVKLNGKKLSPAAMLAECNRLGGKHGVGRVDMVESRFVGMKSRGVYETPGGAILWAAHRDLEGITLDRDLMNLRDGLMPRFAALAYNGFWFSDEMRALAALSKQAQKNVAGTVRLELYKGNITPLGRKSPRSLYDEKIASMSDDHGAYDQSDATGFIRLHSLPLRAAARRGK